MKRYPKMRNRVRKFNKQVLNRAMIKIAGVVYSPVAMIRHTGRRSGKPYQTPIIVMPIPGGFVFALTYGPAVDWYQNELVAGQCNLKWHGREFVLEKPEPVDVKTALAAFPPPFKQILGVSGIEDFFKMTISPSEMPVN